VKYFDGMYIYTRHILSDPYFASTECCYFKESDETKASSATIMTNMANWHVLQFDTQKF